MVSSPARFDQSTLNCTPSTPSLLMALAPPRSTLFPYTTLFRSVMVTVGGVTSFTTVKTLELVAVPPGVVTLRDRQSTRLNSIHANISYATTFKNKPLTPLNVTAVAPVKFVPVIVTMVPTGPLVGVKLLIVGGLTTVTLTAEVAVLPAASRAIAVRVCTPFLAVVLFHEPAYGTVVTSA